MKIDMHDIVKISEELAFLNSYGVKNKQSKVFLEMKVIDYALQLAVLKNTTLLEEIKNIKLMKLEEIEQLHKSWFLDSNYLYEIYLKFRYVAGVKYMNVRNWHINEMGFSEELCKILEQYCKHGSPLAENVLRNITYVELKSITKNNQKLIDEFNNLMEKIGLKWIILVDGTVRLDTITYRSQEYIKIDMENVAKQEAKDNNIETKTKLIKPQYNPVLEQPFKSEAFKSMPKEFQDWMKLGYMQQVKQQVESSIPTNQSNRLIEQVINNKQQDKVENKTLVHIEPKKSRRKKLTKQDVFKAIQEDLGLIYNLDSDFIIKNQDELWECIIQGEGNTKSKRILLRYIDDVCNKVIET